MESFEVGSPHHPVNDRCGFASTGPVQRQLPGSSIWAGLRRGRLAWRQTVVAATVAVALPAFSASVFTLATTALPGVTSSSVVCGDFNNDGQADVLVTGADGSFTPISQVWQNHSAGLFTNRNVALPGLSSSAVARGDFNNDGRLDLLLTGFAGVGANGFPIYLSQVWLNSANGTFTEAQAGLPGVNTGAVALGDFDNDGNLDILLTGFSSAGAVAQVWRGNGNGAFTNINAGLPGVLYSAVAWGDLDNDGLLDILLTGTPDGFGATAISQLWRNQGNATFAKLDVVLPGVSQGAVAWGDFDRDGRLDFLLIGNTISGVISQVWRNLGNRVFVNSNAGLPGVDRAATALADYDNDGRLDIVLAGVNAQANPVCQLWRNTSDWVFADVAAGLQGIQSGSVTWVDFDNNGRLDLLLTGLNNGTPGRWLYRNGTALSSASAPRLLPLKRFAIGGYQIAFEGQPGFGYLVWASTNLVQWTALGAANEGSPATFQFSDRQAANLPSRSYRVSRP